MRFSNNFIKKNEFSCTVKTLLQILLIIQLFFSFPAVLPFLFGII